MGEDGLVIPEAEAKVHSTKYICGRCGSKVEEVPLKRVMRIKIERVTKDYVYGKFQNKLRSGVYDFQIDKVNKSLNVDGIKLHEAEREFILNKYKEKYLSSIQSKIVDHDGKQRFEVQVYNPNEVESMITIIVEKGKAIDYYGDREPYRSERERAELEVSQSPYKEGT